MFKRCLMFAVLIGILSSTTVWGDELPAGLKNDIYPKIKLSTGFGLDYGGVGANIELQINKAFGIFGGLGSRGIIGQEFPDSMKNGWSVGSRLYLGEPAIVRPKFTLALGQTHGVIIKNMAGDTVDSATILGFKFGIGLEWMLWNALSLDLDAGIAFGSSNSFTYNNYDDINERVELNPYFSPTAALAWHF